MTRTKAIVTSLAVLCISWCSAQEMQNLSHNFGKDGISYTRYAEEGATLRGIMLGFHPYNPGKWDAALWAKTLQPLAENNSYLLLCPDGGSDSLIDSFQFPAITQLIRLYQDSLSLREMPVILVAFSLGANAGAHYYSVDSLLTGALLVSPTRMPSFRNKTFENKIFSLVYGTEESNANLVPAIRDSLQLKGAWVWETAIKGSGHTFAIPDFYMEYDHRIQWIDSLGHVLANPVETQKLGSSTGLKNNIPEQMRQGQVIELEYFAARPLTMEWVVLDLSGKAIMSGKSFFGKGTNRITIPTRDLSWGVYRLELNTDDGHIEKYKFIIRG